MLSGTWVNLNPLDIVLILVFSLLYMYSLYHIPILIAGVKHLRASCQEIKRMTRLNDKELPTFSIIVPAKDEEKVLDRLLNAFLRLNYPSGKKEIIMVEDGSVDKTAEICTKYVERNPKHVKLLRHSQSNGKPSALNRALKLANGEIVAVLDADNVPAADLLLRVTRYFEEKSIAAVQGRVCSINADENMLTKLVSYEEAVRYETYIRGKDFLNLFVPLTGSCYFIRRRILEDVGGWDDQCLSEDMEMAAKLTEKSHNIRYASDVRSWQENPTNLTELFRQRTRWFRGSMEVSLKYGRLLRKPCKKNVDAEITLTGPFMFLPCLLSYCVGLYSLFSPFSPNPILMLMTHGLTLVNTVTLLLIGAALIYLTRPRRMKNLLWLPFVYAYWMVQNLVALYAFIQILLKRPRKWMKTAKTGVVTSEGNVPQAYV